MSIKPYTINVFRAGSWFEIQSDDLLPGDLVSIMRSKEDSGVPCDLLLVQGSCIVNEAMLSGESTPLLKESIELRPSHDELDIAAADRNSVLFGGTKVLQSSPESSAPMPSKSIERTSPDGGCLAIVLKTGFGTSQGQLVRTMIFSTERVTANNVESFLFIGFLLIFAIAASAYVWIKGKPRTEHECTRLSIHRRGERSPPNEAAPRLRHHYHLGRSSGAAYGVVSGCQHIPCGFGEVL
jgi:cation-transporting ATPase 13A1